MTLTGSVLITGGSGTLGTAIVRTALQEKWDADFTIFSRSELRQAQMRQAYGSLRYVLGDVRDYERLAAAVAGHDLVIHAAATKRIPEAEAQPINCIETNVTGTINAARACVAAQVKTAIFISTDKACRSITTYGHSKGMGEGVWRSFAPYGQFVAVRYGNVVASNGSVIPLWRQQAKQGQAISVTQRDATRFWMAESDAVALIQQAAGSIAGTITVPKMRSLTLVELASIVAPGADVVETGFRSVEKRHEDLVSADEISADAGDVFIIGHPQGSTGHRYTSYDAPRLMPAAFRSMLAEAEGHD